MSKINIGTKILGLTGYPLEHSLSPLLHNQALKDLSLNYVYLPLPVKPDDLEDGIKAVRALDIRGLNVTIPYKEKVIPYLDKLESLAEEIGAVNTIVNDNGKLTGYNTDCSGFKRMLEEDGSFNIAGKKAIIIGAGGASRAVGTALASGGIDEIYLLNRTRERAENLVQDWQKNYPAIIVQYSPLIPEYYLPLCEKADLIVDTTPVGMNPETDVPPVIEKGSFHSGQLVVDLVYNPQETTILKAAKEKGAETLNGLGMLLYQAADAFKLWTGYEPDLVKWRSAVNNC